MCVRSTPKVWQNDERNPEDRVASPSRDDLYREGPCGLGFKRWIGVHQFRRTNNSESLAIEAGQGLRRLLRNSWRVRFGRGGVERSASRGSCSERRFRSPRAVLRIRVRCLIRDSASLSSVISGLVWLVVKGAYSRERLPPGGARCLVALLVVDSEEGQ